MHQIHKGDKVNGGNEVLWTHPYGTGKDGAKGTAADPLVHYKDKNGNPQTEPASKVKKN